VTELGKVREKRHHQRLELELEVIIRTESALLPGRTQDISESGMSVILPVELHEGEEVELQIKLPSATETIRAVVRHRNVFRHGFEFVQPLRGIVDQRDQPFDFNNHLPRLSHSAGTRGRVKACPLGTPSAKARIGTSQNRRRN
jgi:PilZ domain